MFPLNTEEVKEIKETLQILESKLQATDTKLSSEDEKKLSIVYFNISTLIDWLTAPQEVIMKDIDELNEMSLD